jgi:hypothetical protein
MNKIFNKNNLWSLIAAVLAIHMLAIPFTVYLNLVDKGPTWLGLDDSARMTLNYAWIKHWNWGNDIIYTYGPLSFLSTKVGYGISRWLFLVLDLFVVVNFFLMFKDFILRAESKILAILLLFCVTVLITPFYGSGLAWILLIFIYYWMYKTYEDPRLSYFIILILLIALSFYIKLNTGLFVIVFLVIHVSILFIIKKVSLPKALLIVGILIAVLLAGAWGFNVSLIAYAKGAVEVMRGYNDLLYLYEDHPGMESSLLTIFFVTGFLMFIYALLILKKKAYPHLFFIMISAAYLFLIKKQAMFRNDTQHLEEFFIYAPLVLVSGNMLFIKGAFQKIYLLLAIIILAYSFRANIEKRPLAWALKDRYTILPEYVKQFTEYDPARFCSQKSKRYIPTAVLQEIGNKSIDVFPWDSEYLIENELNYKPRPTFQTFQANSDYLQQTNYNYYLKNGPEYVLYDYDGIDNSYPFNDAPTLNLFLAKNYTVRDSFTSNERWRILLKRKPAVQPVILSKIKEAEVGIKSEIDVEQAEYFKIGISYSLKGKIRAFWNRPSPLSISMMDERGTWTSYKTSTELLKTGIFVKKRILNNMEFAQFVSGNDTLQGIKKIRFDVIDKHFNDKMKLEYFKVN